MKLLLTFICFTLFVQLSHSHDTPAIWLQLHNKVRAKLHEVPLTWNTTLAKYATKYSQRRSGDCQLIHSQGPYGENIYWGQGQGETDAAAAMRCWVDEEVNHYDYKTNKCLGGVDCLHYTQIVWNTTRQLGCGSAMCQTAENKVFITCNYYPPGNIDGQRPY